MQRIIKPLSLIVLFAFFTTVVLGGSGWGVEIKTIQLGEGTAETSNSQEASLKLYTIPITGEATTEAIRGLPKYKYTFMETNKTTTSEVKIKPEIKYAEPSFAAPFAIIYYAGGFIIVGLVTIIVEGVFNNIIKILTKPFSPSKGKADNSLNSESSKEVMPYGEKIK